MTATKTSVIRRLIQICEKNYYDVTSEDYDFIKKTKEKYLTVKRRQGGDTQQ